MRKDFSEIKPKKRKSFDEIKSSDIQYGVDDNYIASFVNDANNWLSKSQSDYGNMNFNNNQSMFDTKSSESAALSRRANTIRAFINSKQDKSINKEKADEILNYLDEFGKANDQVFNAYRQSSDAMNVYKRSPEYQGYMTAKDYADKYGNGTTYNDVIGDVDKLKQDKNSKNGYDALVYDKAIEMLSDYAKNRYSLTGTDNSKGSVKGRQELYNQNADKIEELQAELPADKEADAENPYRFVSNKDEALRTWLYYYDRFLINTDEDNEQYIQTIKDDTGFDISDVVGGLDGRQRAELSQELSNKYNQIGEKDYLDYRDEKVGDKQAEIDALTTANNSYDRTQKAVDEYMDKYRDLASDYFHGKNVDFPDIPRYSDNPYENAPIYSDYVPPEAGDITQPMIGGAVDATDLNGVAKAYQAVDAHTEMLSSDEKMIYSYILKTEGEIRAKAFLEKLKPILQRRAAQAEEDYIKNEASGVEKAILAASSVPINVLGSAPGFLEDAINVVSGNEINPYSEAHHTTNLVESTRNAVQNDIESATNGANLAGFTLGDLYQAGMSTADAALGSIMPTYYAASMSMGAAQSKAKDLWESGAPKDQIYTESILAGAAEYAFEKISMDKIISLNDKGSAKEKLKNILKSAFIEGSEEFNTDIANTIVDAVVRGSQSDWNQLINNYIKQGHSKEEAQALALVDIVKQAGKSFVGGALSGAGMSGAVSINKAAGLIQEKADYNNYVKNVGNDVTSAGNIQTLLSKAAQMDNPAVKAQAQRTQQALDKATQNSTKSTNKRLSREAGKLYDTMQDSTAQGMKNAKANEIKAAIKSAYAAQTGETDSSVISKAADAIYKSEYTHERLTRSERNLAKTAAAQSAIESVKSNPDLIESATQKAQERGFRELVETAKLTKNQEQETKTDDDVDIAEFNYHEDDGKVYTADGKKQVDIASVASIGDNDITFNLNDGQTESAKSLDMPTNQAVIAQSILDVQKKIGVPLTADIANTLYQGYEQSDSPSVSAYMQDAQTVLFNGYANNTAPDSSIKLPQGLRNQLYRMGRQLAASHTQAQQQNVNARVKGNKSRKGTVTFQDGINRNKLDPRRRAGVDAVEHLAQSLGFDVVFYRSTKDGKGRFSSEYVRKNKFVADGQQAPSGFWRGGKMYLDINAGMNGEGLILFTASHELVHMIREGSPEDFKALSDFLVQNYSKQGVDINDLVRKEMARSTNLTRDQALEEVIAESCETFLRDTTLNDKAQELYKQNPTLWSRIREALKRIVDAVKQWHSVARPQSEEARITMRADVETLENAYDLLIKGIIKSAENLRNMENNRTDTKYQGRAEAQDTEYLDAVERGDMDTAQRMVDEAAKEAGYNTPMLYHGTQKFGFTQFDLNKMDDGMSIFLTSTEETASTYSGVTGSRGVNETTVKSYDDLQRMSAKELVDEANRYNKRFHNDASDVEYRYYSYDDIKTMRDETEKKLKQLKPAIQEIGYKYANKAVENFDDNYHEAHGFIRELLKAIDNPVFEKGHTSRDIAYRYSTLGADIEWLVSREFKEFNTDEYKDLYDTLFVLNEIAEEKLKGKEAIIKVIGEDGIKFYIPENVVSLRNELLREVGSGNYGTFAKLQNPLVIEADGSYWNRIPISHEIWSALPGLDRHWDRQDREVSNTRAISAYAKDNGYDGVIFKNLDDNGGRNNLVNKAQSDVYVVFDSAQVKSADPVTYDDNGEVIPLSERFNTAQKDIRYQSRDSEYLDSVNSNDMKTAQNLVDEAAERAFENSAIRGEDGKLIKMYHGTDSDFTVFDIVKYGGKTGTAEGLGINLIDRKEGASGYGSRVIESYVNITKPAKTWEKTITRNDLVKLIRKSAETEAQRMVEEDDYGSVTEALKDTWISNYVNTYEYSNIEDVYKEVADTVLRYNTNDRDIVWEVVNGSGANYSNENWIKFYNDILKPTIGIDGFWTTWAAKDGKRANVVIAFDSSQVKSAEPVTYDDKGEVIPLSERFDTTKTDIRYQERGGDFFDIDDMFDDDSISSTVAREYITHHEDIGEVLRNIADIELPSSKVQSIVNRVIRSELGYLDEEARRTLSIELQLALERVSKTDAQDVSNEMINAVRKAVEGARITDERTQASYQDLRNVFKGKKFYLSDEQINQLKEHDMTFDDFRKAMFGKVTIVKRENAKRSINGGYADAQHLSLEGLHDVLDNPEEVLEIRRDEWDNKNYDAPYIIKKAFDTLREQQSQLVTDMYSDEAIDDMAIAIAAKITGDIVEAKYNSRKNPYVSKLVKDLQAKRTEAVNRQKERNKQKLAELKTKERERAEKREQDLKKKYQEQRDRNREGRKRTELRGKIRKLTDSLQKRLTAPKGKQYVPRELISQTVDVLNAVNLDSGRSTRLSEKLAALRNEYDKLKEREESYAMHNGVVSTMLLGLSDSVGNTPIMKMTLSQLKQVYDVIRSMDYVIRESVKMTDTNFKKETHQIGRDWMAEIKAVPKEHVGILSGYVQAMLSAERFFNRIAGFKKNSTSSQLFDMLNKGQLAQTQYEMEFTQIFADLIQDKQLKSLYDTKNLVDIGLEDEDGNKVPITRGMMLSLYMHLLNEDNTRHVMGGGLTVPNMKDYYKGDVKKAFGSGMKSVRVGELDYSQYVEGIKSVIERQLTEYEIKWIEAAQEFFDVASRKALNETTMKLYGFRRANVNNYFPIHTDSNYRAATFENIVRDMSLENSGFMKERVKASNPILLEDIVDVINDQISKVAKYCGMTLPIRNFQKVYGTTTFGFETSVQRELNSKFSASSKNTGATKYIDNLLTDLTSGRSTDEGFIARMMGRARGNLAQATLTLNPRVAIAQAASYPTAAAVIGWEPLFKALRKGGKNNTVFSRADREAIAEISPLLWKRTQGYSNVEIGDIKELRKQRHQVEGKLKKAMGWIEFFDGMTVGRLFYACQYYVDEQNPELKRGTAEYNAKVADVYNNVIERTQPNYTTLQRPDILRNPNAIIKSLSMFMTQRLQNFNIVYDAVGTYNRYLNDYKKGLNEVTAEDVKGARTTLVRSVTSQLVAAGTIVGMKLLADVLLHSMNGYRDDDDELTAESVSLKLLDNFADTLFGSVLFGSDLYSLVKSKISGSRYYGISLSGVDSFVDAVTSIVNLRSTLDSVNKAATSVCQLFGIPLNNAEKIGKAIYYWVSDISGGEAFESGVNRTNKQNIHRYETRLNSGEVSKAKELLIAMLDDKMSQGKTEKEAKSWLRGRFTETYKQRYIDAVNQKNAEEVKNIREILLSTGLYGSLSDLDKSLKKWLK